MIAHDAPDDGPGAGAGRSGPKADPRAEVRLTIYYSSMPQEMLKDYSLNLSTGGVFIETVDILPVDTALFVVFALPGRDIPISCEARVAWSNEPGTLKKTSLPPGMGLQFLNLSLKDMYLIREFLNNGVVTPTW